MRTEVIYVNTAREKLCYKVMNDVEVHFIFTIKGLPLVKTN